MNTSKAITLRKKNDPFTKLTLKKNFRRCSIADFEKSVIDKSDCVMVLEDSDDEESHAESICIISDSESSDEEDVKVIDNPTQENKCDNDSDSDLTNPRFDKQLLADVLNDIYGNSWIKSKDEVFSASHNNKKKELPTEKTKSQSLQKSIFLQRTPNTKAVESPWKESLKKLCDKDTSSDESSYENKLEILKKKLSFDDAQEEVNIFDKVKSLPDNSLFIENSSKDSAQDFKDPIDNDKKIISSKNKNKPVLQDVGRNDTQNTHKNLEPFDKALLDSINAIIGPQNFDKENLVINDDYREKPKVKPNTQNDNGINKEKKTVVNKIGTDNKKSKGKKDNVGSKAATTKKGANVTTSENDSTKSFLASLSKNVKTQNCDPTAKIFRDSFSAFKNQLVEKLFKLFNENVFSNGIHSDTPIEWSNNMTRTAGFCYLRLIKHSTGSIEHKIKIVLSSKVLDSADRLRDTLIHEMCHGAAWIIDKLRDGHGSYFKAWAERAIKTFPELPPIKTCHSYTINYKYTYRCISCNYSISRHSKSIDVERKRCGYCYGTFELLINKKTKDGVLNSVPVTPKRAPNAFALFVKDNYATFKKPQLDHAQVMKMLGAKFNELKVSCNKNS